MVVINLSSVRKNKKLLLGMLITLFLCLALMPWNSGEQQVVLVTSSNTRLLPIYAVDTQDKKIAISFDATWGAEETPKILATLKKYNIKTTFFLVNIWLKKFPEVTKTIAADGHEIGLHSTTHPYFTKLSTEQMKQELKDNHDMIKQICNYDAKLFRPPFGDYDNRVISAVNELGFQTIQWSADSLDWKDLSAQAIYDRVMGRMKPGAIVLFHNNGKHTSEAIESIIPALLKEGYKIVPVSQLIYKQNFFIDPNGTQKKR